MKLDQYVKEGILKEKLIIDVLSKHLPSNLKITTRENQFAGYDSYCILLDEVNNESNGIKLELESTLTMKYWKNKIPPRYRWKRGLSVPIRKYNDKWDIYIKFSYDLKSFYALEFNYFNKYAKQKTVPNVSDHVKKNNEIFMDLQWREVDGVKHNDDLYNGYAVCMDNFNDLIKLLLKKLNRRK